jgi:hypothetical protein
VIIPQCRRMNQLQYEVNPITGRIPITQETQDFSPDVHVFTGTQVPIGSTTLGDSVAKRCCTNLVQQMDTARTYSHVR